MTKMMHKLKQKKGETLVETLFSMLIALLSMGMLCTCILAATNINKNNREADEKFSEQLKKAESMVTPNTMETNDSSNVLKITFKINGVEQESKTIQNVDMSDPSLIFYAGEEEDHFISYQYLP